ncbi:MAG: NAD-dependent epimerase/dehydratase family protein [bacterium]|nr:NAD-dependent epimerase/dehydratase family protein [bacterium]
MKSKAFLSESKKILVTGGAGFVGSTLADELVKLGHQVTVLDNLVTGKREYLNPQAKFYKVDICSDEVSRIFSQEAFDLVFHLAAQIDVRKSVEDPIFDNKVNVFGSLNILKNCLENKVEKIFFSSTGGAVYGDASEIPTTEKFLPSPICPYGIHKLTFEKYLNYYYQVYGQKYLTLRPANIYGPRQYNGGEAGVISIFVDNTVNKRRCIISGDGTQTRDFVYVDDIVQAFLKAMYSNFVGEINIGTGRETNLLEVVKAIETALGNDIEKVHGPARPGEQMRSCLDAKRAKEILHWKAQVDLKTGIKKTIEWSKNKKHPPDL